MILLIVLVTTVTINAGPAPDISKLYIKGCWCNKDGNAVCGVVQYGYALRGGVFKTWNYGPVSTVAFLAQ